jgi:hypothetical protein
MLELIGIVILLVILVRVTAVSIAAQVSTAQFMECLAHTEEPAVIEVHRSISWLLGPARNRYILVFRGHRIHTRSFRPIAFPDGVVVIETRTL